MPPFKPPFNFKYKLFFSRSIHVFRSMAMPLEFTGQSGTFVVVAGSHELVVALLHSPLVHLAFKLIAHYIKTQQI